MTILLLLRESEAGPPGPSQNMITELHELRMITELGNPMITEGV